MPLKTSLLFWSDGYFSVYQTICVNMHVSLPCIWIFHMGICIFISWLFSKHSQDGFADVVFSVKVKINQAKTCITVYMTSKLILYAKT